MKLSLIMFLFPDTAAAFLSGYVGRSTTVNAMSKQHAVEMFDGGSSHAHDLAKTAKLDRFVSDLPETAKLDHLEMELLKRDLLVERLIDESAMLLPLDGAAGMSIDEHVKAFSVTVSTGSVPKDLLHVSVEGDVLTVEGDTRGEELDRSWRSSFSRSLRLPSNADWNSPDVQVIQDARGTLNIRIPKSAAPQLKEASAAPRRVLEINASAAIAAGDELKMMPDVEEAEILPGAWSDVGEEAQEHEELSGTPHQPRERYVGRRRILRDM